jgi:hypothetical protein
LTILLSLVYSGALEAAMPANAYVDTGVNNVAADLHANDAAFDSEKARASCETFRLLSYR